jgi:hypothetical protein
MGHIVKWASCAIVGQTKHSKKSVYGLDMCIEGCAIGVGWEIKVVQDFHGKTSH